MKSYNHRVRGDYNTEFLYSPMKIILRHDKKLLQQTPCPHLGPGPFRFFLPSLSFLFQSFPVLFFSFSSFLRNTINKLKTSLLQLACLDCTSLHERALCYVSVLSNLGRDSRKPRKRFKPAKSFLINCTLQNEMM